MRLKMNFRAKIVAVLCAVLFWAYVVGTGEKIRVFGQQVDVETFNAPEKVIVVNDEDLGQVKVSVRALDKDFSELNKEDIVAYIDVAGLEVGKEHKVPVKVTIDNPQVKLSKVEPAELVVRLDKITSNSVTVDVESEGTVASGFTLNELQSSERRARVEGAESLVQRVSRVVAHLKLSGDEHDSIERQVTLIAVDEAGKEISGITIIPASVIVEGQIAQVTNTKTAGVVANLTTKSLAAGFWIKDVKVSPSSVQIEGSPGVLAGIENLKTEQIDIEGLDKDLTQKVSLLVPAGAQLSPGLSSSVTVTIMLSSEASKRELFADINLVNVPEGVTVAKVEPGSLKIEISGPLPDVGAVNEETVMATVNAANAQEGIRRYDITSAMLSLPSGITIESMSPREVRVLFEAAATTVEN